MELNTLKNILDFLEENEDREIPSSWYQLIRKNKSIVKNRHKSAKFLHVRMCNLMILRDCPYASGSNNEAIKARRKIRLDSLKKDLPKGFAKRILWAISIKKVGYCED